MPRRLLPLLLVLAVLLAPRFLLSPLPGEAQDDPLQATTRTVNVELILDASGSMAEVLPDGEMRMDAAKRILRDVINDLPEREGINVGLRVYGHLGTNTEADKQVSCRSSELFVPVAGLDKAALIGNIEGIQPTGWTPIAYSLEQAAADFQPGGESVTNAIVLVTDGEETCDPPEQSCAAAAALHQAGISVTTHVVGFALDPNQVELVRCVAQEGGGQLFDAKDANQLGGAINQALVDVGVALTPIATPADEPAVSVAQPAVPAPAALAEIRTLAYHQLTQWTSGANDRGEESPILSDDGQRIAFTRAPGSGDPATPNRIFVINADGSDEREVDAYPPLCACGSMIDISADGSRIVSTDGVQVRIADGNGGGGSELLALDSGEINALRISGNGSTIVFRIYRDATMRAPSPGDTIARGIYVINADGSGLRQVVGPTQMAPLLEVAPEQVSPFGAIWGLDVSANGAQIVFATYVSGFETQGLFGVNLDGSGLLKLIGPVTSINDGAISGDGTTVAYVTADSASGLQEAGVIGFDGSGQRKLTDSTTLHPGTGNSLPSGERIQLSFDGSRLLLGSTGLLYDTTGEGVLALGVDTRGSSESYAPVVVDGLFRATMNAAATRVVYLFQPPGEPYQLARIDLNPTDLGEAPNISEAGVDPTFVLTETRSKATVSARVSTTNSLLGVGNQVLRNGLPDDTVGTYYYGPLVDDGTTGDTTANDETFTNDTLGAFNGAEVGPRAVRIKAETQTADGLRHGTAVDVTPFAVVTDPAEAPVATPATPTAPTATETAIPPVVTPPTDPIQATIAAQATRIAELEGTLTPTPIPPTNTPIPPTNTPIPTNTPTPYPVTTPDAAQAMIAAQATRIAELEGTLTPPVPTSTPDAAQATIATQAARIATLEASPAAEQELACTVAPRDVEEVVGFYFDPEGTPLVTPTITTVMDEAELPQGEPANAETVAAVQAVLEQFSLCWLAEQEARYLALMTDDMARQAEPDLSNPDEDTAEEVRARLEAELATTPTAGPVWQVGELGDVRVLEPGRVGVILTIEGDASFVVFEEENGKWLLDDFIDIVENGAGATSTVEPESDISLENRSLLALLPTQDQVPDGLVLVAEAEQSKEEVISGLGGPEGAAELLDEWGWSGTVYREFRTEDPSGPTAGVTSVIVSAQRFADAESAANAVDYWADAAIARLELRDVAPPALGEPARLLEGEFRGWPFSALYAQQGPILYRVGIVMINAEGDPTSDVLAVAGEIIPQPEHADYIPIAGTVISTDSTTAADYVTPDPAECTVTPRTADELTAIGAASDQDATNLLMAAVVAPGLDIPEGGVPADAATTAAVTTTYHQIFACRNAGNDLAVYALWTDEAIHQSQVDVPAGGPPTPVSDAERSAFRVTRVLVLPDGQVVAVWEEQRFLSTTTVVQTLVQQGDRYLVDATLDVMRE